MVILSLGEKGCNVALYNHLLVDLRYFGIAQSSVVRFTILWDRTIHLTPNYGGSLITVSNYASLPDSHVQSVRLTLREKLHFCLINNVQKKGSVSLMHTYCTRFFLSMYRPHTQADAAPGVSTVAKYDLYCPVVAQVVMSAVVGSRGMLS